ncbi:MAG: N-acetyltransferase family protein [Rudaea sp.]
MMQAAVAEQGALDETARLAMSDVIIRPITLGDIEQFGQVTDRVMRERRYMAFVEGFPIDEAAAFVARNLRLRNPQLVADDGGRVVGWCDIRRETIPVYAHAGHLGMGLLPEYRGRGIGERLLRASIEAARAAGFERIELTVYARNERAFALYRKVGFVHEGTRTRGKKLDGEYDDVYMMGMLL